MTRDLEDDIKRTVDNTMLKTILKIKEFVYPKAKKFIDKVESGRARSRETYADMKEIVKFFDEYKEK